MRKYSTYQWGQRHELSRADPSNHYYNCGNPYELGYGNSEDNEGVRRECSDCTRQQYPGTRTHLRYELSLSEWRYPSGVGYIQHIRPRDSPSSLAEYTVSLIDVGEIVVNEGAWRQVVQKGRYIILQRNIFGDVAPGRRAQPFVGMKVYTFPKSNLFCFAYNYLRVRSRVQSIM